MDWTYDVEADAAYVRLAPGESSSQVELAGGVVVDLDAHGTLVGVEIIGPCQYDALAELPSLGATPDQMRTVASVASAIGGPAIPLEPDSLSNGADESERYIRDIDIESDLVGSAA